MKPKNFPERKRQRQLAALERMQSAMRRGIGMWRGDQDRLRGDIAHLERIIPAESQRNIRTKKRGGKAARQQGRRA